MVSVFSYKYAKGLSFRFEAGSRLDFLAAASCLPAYGLGVGSGLGVGLVTVVSVEPTPRASLVVGES